MMVATLKIENFSAQVEDKLRRSISQRLDLAANGLSRIVKQNLSMPNNMGTEPSEPGQMPRASLALLKRSVHVEKPSENVRLVGSNSPYSLILELGGTIYAKGKKMPVPLSDKAKRHAARDKGPRDFPVELHVLPKGNGNVFLVERKARRGKKGGVDLVFHYILKGKVDIRARPYLRPALLSEEFRMVLHKAFSGAEPQFTAAEDVLT